MPATVRRSATGVAALVITLSIGLSTALTACSSSKHPATSTTSTPPPSSSAPVSTSPADAQAIRDAYTQFVDPSIPISKKTTLIQDGDGFLPAMQAEAKNPQASEITLQITDVKVTSANLATVTFTLLVKGSPLLPNQHGFAVRENGQWKVAGVTFCGLLAAQGPNSVPSVCSQPAATSLPS